MSTGTLGALISRFGFEFNLLHVIEKTCPKFHLVLIRPTLYPECLDFAHLLDYAKCLTSSWRVSSEPSNEVKPGSDNQMHPVSWTILTDSCSQKYSYKKVTIRLCSRHFLLIVSFPYNSLTMVNATADVLKRALMMSAQDPYLCRCQNDSLMKKSCIFLFNRPEHAIRSQFTDSWKKINIFRHFYPCIFASCGERQLKTHVSKQNVTRAHLSRFVVYSDIQLLLAGRSSQLTGNETTSL